MEEGISLRGGKDKNKDQKYRYENSSIEKHGREIRQRREEMKSREENNMNNIMREKEDKNRNRNKDGKMSQKETNKMEEGEEETERERETRLRNIRRKKESIREWLKQNNYHGEMGNTSKEEEDVRSVEEGEIKKGGSTSQEGVTTNASTRLSSKTGQQRDITKAVVNTVNEVKTEKHKEIQSYKRKLEDGKEKEIEKNKKGKEDKAIEYRKGSEEHSKEENTNIQSKAGGDRNTWRTRESGVRFDGLKMIGHNKAEIRYKSRQEANKILEEGRFKPEDCTTYIPQRWKMRKGVIHEWEDSIMELEDQLMPNQGVFTLERLKKKKMKDGKAVWEEGKSILLKMQGESLPTKLLIGYGHVWLRVEPFVEATKQCFKCLRFGHIQAGCRANQRKCFVCSGEFHGRCTENPKCTNCGGSHLSVARECQVFQKEVTIKKIMAYKNISYFAASEMVRKEEKLNRLGEDYQEEDEEREEDWNKDFPRLSRHNKINYWEQLSAPVERELGKLKRVWERNKDTRRFRGNEDRDRREGSNIKMDNRTANQYPWGHGSGMTKGEIEKKTEYKNNKGSTQSRQRDIQTTYENGYKNDTGRKQYETTKNKDEKSLHFIPRIHRMVNEEEFDPYNEGAPRRYIMENNQKEEERRKYNERKQTREIRDSTMELNKKEDDELIEEIIKILKNRNIMEKTVRRIGETQVREQQYNTGSIEEEEDWNKPVTKTFDMTLPQKYIDKKRIRLINKCLTEDEKSEKPERSNREWDSNGKNGRRVTNLNSKEKDTSINKEMDIETQINREEETNDEDILKEETQERYSVGSEDETITGNEVDSNGTVEWLEEKPSNQEEDKGEEEIESNSKMEEERDITIEGEEEGGEEMREKECENQLGENNLDVEQNDKEGCQSQED